MSSEVERAREHLFEIACFLISSARGCFREPKAYGPLRLLQAFMMVADLPKYVEELKDEFIERMRDEISKNLILVLDERKFEEFISKLNVEVAREVKKRFRRGLLPS